MICKDYLNEYILCELKLVKVNVCGNELSSDYADNCS